jgi:CRP/FNR family cyclic AMP-dependent transcriptional regulator
VLSTTDKMFFLRRVSLFAAMSLEQIRVLASHLEEQHFLPSEVIIYEGEFSQELYLLMSGRVRIAKDYGGPHECTLAVLTQGDFFGDMAIFESAPRSATAVAEEESELLVLRHFSRIERASSTTRGTRRRRRLAGGRCGHGGLAAVS